MASDFIMDFETLGISDNTVILSIGVLKCPELEMGVLWEGRFIELFDSGLYIKLNRKEQIAAGRIVEKITLEWWKQQGSEAQSVLNNENLITIYDAYVKVCMYLKNNGFNPKESKIWSRGMIDQRWWGSFCNMLKDLNKDKNIIDPLPFWIWRDTRTMLDLLTGNPNGTAETPMEFIKHNALSDCCMDFLRIHKALIEQ